MSVHRVQTRPPSFHVGHVKRQFDPRVCYEETDSIQNSVLIVRAYVKGFADGSMKPVSIDSDQFIYGVI